MSTQHRGFLSELKATLLLAAPIIAGHVSQMLMGLADTVMIGRVSVDALAAASLANSIGHVAFVIGIGLMGSVSILVAHAFGAGRTHTAGEVLRCGLLLAALFGLLIIGGVGIGLPFIGLLGQPPAVGALCGEYMLLLAISMPFALLTIGLKNFAEAQSVAWPALWAGVLSVFLNVLLNWMLIYGKLGLPAMGLNGAGWATILSRAFGFALLWVWLLRDVRLHASWPRRWFGRFHWQEFPPMLRIGLPIGLQIAMEVGAFTAATLLMGRIHATALAAHQIAITYAATTFMVPLGLSIAVSIRVGHAMGVGDRHAARTIGFGAIGFAALLSALFSTGLILFREPLSTIVTTDPAVVQLAMQLLVIAAIFQFFDGTQVVSMGALRGAKDVRIPTLIAFTAYWLIAIPTAAACAFLPSPADPSGIWIGLATGLGSAALALSTRFWRLIYRRH